MGGRWFFSMVLGLLVLGACGPEQGEYVCPEGYSLAGTLCLPETTDRDGDGIDDDQDNCPDIANPEQDDLDSDTVGDECDLDDDADGILDIADNCPWVSNPSQEDFDEDGDGDLCDLDDDNDGVPDEQDVCPRYWDPAQADTDGDGEGNGCDDDDDDDGVPDDFDNCPVFANPGQADSDYDGVGDLCQDDDDGDGIPNGYDNCPEHPNVAQNDTDLDGEGNACDADDDGDGVLDLFDNCPQAANPDQEDADGNTVGDACEGDMDGDGIPDEEDNCPVNANADQEDMDGDEAGDLCDQDANGDGLPDLIAVVTPSGGLTAGGDDVLLRGTGFQSGATVAFGGVAASGVRIAGPELIFATSPQGSQGVVDITVTNPDGRILTAYDAFEYVDTTQVRGLVLDSNLVPVPNVIVDLTPSDGLPIQAVTDATGNFVLEEAPEGERLLEFNPSNAGVPGGPSYPALKFPVVVEPGKINVVGDGRPTFLPILDTTHVVQIDPTVSATVGSSNTSIEPGMAGASLTLTAGNAVDENGAPYSGEILVSEVAPTRTPISLHPHEVPLYLITIQPAGVEFLEPAPVSFPNVAFLPVGMQVPLRSMNHDTGEFEEVGTLEVNAAGDRLETVDGGVRTSSWHFPLPFEPAQEPPPLSDEDKDKERPDPEEDSDEEDGCGEGGSSFDYDNGNLRIEHRLIPYTVPEGLRGFRLEYTVQGAQPRSLIRTRYLRTSQEQFLNRSLPASFDIDGESFHETTVASPRVTVSFSEPLFVDTILPVDSLDTGIYELTTNMTLSIVSCCASSVLPVFVWPRVRDRVKRLLVWNARSSAFGVGWGFPELSRLHFGSSTGAVLLAAGDGSMKAFEPPSGNVGTAASPSGDLSTLEFLPDGTFEHLHPDGRLDLYDASGFLFSRTDFLGGTTDFLYDENFRLVEVIDSGGASTLLDYSGAWLASVTDPTGRVTTFEHDATGHLTQIVDPGGAVRTFTYDALSRLDSQTSAVGATTEYTFEEELGSLDTITLSDGTLRAVEPNLQSHPTFGRTYPEDPPAGWDPLTSAAFVNGDGERFEVETNGAGQAIRKTGPDGATVTSDYHGDGRLLTRSMPSGLGLTYEYFPGENQISEVTAVDATGETTSVSFEYDPATGLPSLTLFPDGTSRATEWDASGRPLSSTDLGGGTTTFSYDADGHVISMVTPSGAETTWTRNSDGRVSQLLDPDGVTVSTTYDAVGRKSEVTDPAGGLKTFEWNADNTLASLTDEAGGVSTFTYDAGRRRTSIVDPLGRAAEFTYDGRNRVTERSDPSGPQFFEWTSNNELSLWTRPSGAQVAYTYDAYDRLLEQSQDVGGVTTFTYDLSGKMVEAANSTCILEFEYDGFGRLIREEQIPVRLGLPSFEITHTYDERGRRLSTQTSTGRDIAFTWEDNDVLASITEGALSVEFDYDDETRLVEGNFFGGGSFHQTWSPAGRLESTDFEGASGPLFDWVYTYDSSGLRVASTDIAGNSETYAYDPLGAIVTVDRPGTEQDESFAYDLMGNRTSDPTSSSFVYDGSYRLLETDDFTYVWSADGELLEQVELSTGVTSSFTWNSDSTLTGVTRTSATGFVLSEASYYYDPLGRRVERVVDGLRRFYSYDGSNVLEVAQADYPAINPIPLRRYVFANLDTPLWSVDVNGNASYFVRDGQGNVVGVVDSSGNLVEEYSYSAFGERSELLGAGLDQPLGFHGRPLDSESGLYFFRERYYDPVRGRFISEDQYPGEILSARTFHPYLFGLNNPLALGDPHGSAAVPINGKLKAAGTACVAFCIKASGSISFDSDGNVRIDVCLGLGVGLGGGASASATVGDGAVNTDATISANVDTSVVATAALGPCEVKASAKVDSGDFFDPCNGPSAKAEAKAKCEVGDYSLSAQASTTVDSSGLKTGHKINPPASASKDKKTSAKLKAKIEASATAQVCAGGGGSL